MKKACISQGLVTQAEFDFMYQHLCDVRSFTLIPLDALSTALSRYGCDERSEALVAALGLQRPDDWPAEEEHDDGGGGDGDGGGGGGGGGGDGDGDEGGDAGSGAGDVGGGDGNGVGGSAAGDASSDNVSVAGTEVMDEPPVVDEPQEVMACAVSISGHAAKRQRVDRHAHELSPALEAQLAAFEVHRSKPLNPWREGVAVATATIQSDRARVVRFMNWLMSKYTFKLPPALAILLHPNFGTVAKRYVEELAAEKPTSWLDWDAIQRVRVAAEEALAAAKFNADKLKLTRDVTVLRLLADQPPDRSRRCGAIAQAWCISKAQSQRHLRARPEQARRAQDLGRLWRDAHEHQRQHHRSRLEIGYINPITVAIRSVTNRITAIGSNLTAT